MVRATDLIVVWIGALQCQLQIEQRAIKPPPLPAATAKILAHRSSAIAVPFSAARARLRRRQRGKIMSTLFSPQQRSEIRRSPTDWTVGATSS
jgi:hypothetical protein